MAHKATAGCYILYEDKHTALNRKLCHVLQCVATVRRVCVALMHFFFFLVEKWTFVLSLLQPSLSSVFVRFKSQK